MQTGFLSTPVNQRKTFWKMEAPVWDLGTRLLPLPAPAGALNCPPATDCPQRPGSDLKTANSLVSVTFFMLLLGLNAGVEVSALTPQREGSNPGGVLSVLVLSRHSGLLQRSKPGFSGQWVCPLVCTWVCDPTTGTCSGWTPPMPKSSGLGSSNPKRRCSSDCWHSLWNKCSLCPVGLLRQSSCPHQCSLIPRCHPEPCWEALTVFLTAEDADGLLSLNTEFNQSGDKKQIVVSF